jgi:branched-chain amino acid transport system ATP-binding protein
MVEPVLDIRDLSRAFGALKATDGVTLDLRPGEIHALIGPNGAGKSTLIKQICGSVASDRGAVFLGGEDISGLHAAERARKGLGRTFQVSSLALEFSALRNVMLAVQAISPRPFGLLRPVMRDHSLVDPANICLERVGLGARAHVPASDLSHGERRQLEIAIALALEPKVFLLDEPMAGMGPEGSKRLTEFLATLKSEAPILLVEHDMDAVFALADRVSVLVYGRIVATGSVEDIRRNPVVREAYLGGDAA